MIRANVISPQPSWNNDHPTLFPTGFTYVSNVPPRAFGPQRRESFGDGGAQDAFVTLAVGVAAIGVLTTVGALLLLRRKRR